MRLLHLGMAFVLAVALVAGASSNVLTGVFSVPRCSLVGRITDGISQPQGLAVDKYGNLYVANLNAKTVTAPTGAALSPATNL
jgi:hypothetical protein